MILIVFRQMTQDYYYCVCNRKHLPCEKEEKYYFTKSRSYAVAFFTFLIKKFNSKNFPNAFYGLQCYKRNCPKPYSSHFPAFFQSSNPFGNGTPLQYSGLENPMDGGAWQAAVHGVAKSRTRLSDFTFTFHSHALEKEMATHSSVLAWRIPGMGSYRVGHD